MPATDAPIVEQRPPAISQTSEVRSDGDLLRLYAQAGDEQSFAKVVSRHYRWVYASALRQLRDPADAEDVAQAVFVALARKASSLQRETALAGWLFRAARYAAIDMIRANSRRSKREQTAFVEAISQTETTWEHVEPIVDECLAQLPLHDQTAVLLRFYEQKGWREIGAALGLKENTARVRVERALIKLRNLLARRGVRESAAGLALLLLANAAQASVPGSVTARPEIVAALARAVGQRFFVHKAAVVIAVALLTVMLAATIESFRRVPLAQDRPLQFLVGADLVDALRDLDQAFMSGNPDQFIDRIHFRNDTYLRFHDELRDYLIAVAEFRSVGARRFRNPMFGYYATLDELLVGRERPTTFERHGQQATGIFARNRGLHLIQVGNRWKWNFFEGSSDTQWQERFRILKRKTELLHTLAAQMKSDPLVTETGIIDAFRTQ